MSQSARDLIVETFEDLTVLAPGDPLDETEATRALQKLTRLFDNWNAERAGVYASRLTTYTLTPSLQPHTIGPAASTPTFTVTQRPVSIDAANLVVGSGATAVHYPLTVHMFNGWASVPIPGLSTSMPTDLFYSPDWPLGRIYLSPVPDTANGLELLTRIVLADLALDDTVNLPPGYRDAIALTLGEMLAPSYPPAVAQPEAAAKARARIFANNDVPVRQTSDAYRTSRGGGWSILRFYRGY